jgi:adenylate cyclase
MPDQAPALSLDDLPHWLAEAGLAGMKVEDVLAGFVRRLNDHDFHVGRAYIGIRLLNPLIRAEGYIYERRADQVTRETYEHAAMPVDYHRSPIHHMLTQKEYHLFRPLTGPQAVLDFDALREFAARGFSAWSAHLIPFTLLAGAARPEEPLGFIITACCDHPAGWQPAHRQAFERLLPHLAAAIQGRVFATLAQDLLTTYLGGDAAARVLGGITTRGDLRVLRAAILYADLRGFTALAETLPPERLLASLDRHFDRLVAPIEIHGGQVLKFMGDGLLAVFPVDGGAEASACGGALAAARDALAANLQLRETATDAMPLDLALHLGDVHYGNVGGVGRLDFTVIGPAVNVAARMEQKCQEIGAALLLSETIARRLEGADLRSLGRHALRGIAGTHELFTLP